jgi:hypothetical protein
MSLWTKIRTRRRGQRGIAITTRAKDASGVLLAYDDQEQVIDLTSVSGLE